MSPARRDPDLAVAHLSRRQHGVWSRRQAIEAGVSPKALLGRARSGRWVRRDTGVLASAAVEPTWESSVMAAVLAEPWAVASHRTAAVLHALEGYRPGRPHITVRPGANARGQLAVVHRGTDVQTTTVDRIPVTTVAQTFVDLSQWSHHTRVLDALRSRVLVQPGVIGAIQDRYCELAPRGGRNLRRLRSMLEALDEDDQVAESELELKLHDVLRSPLIPAIRWQVPFPGRTPGTSRVDGLIPAWSMIIEGDGRSWHARVRAFESDRRRDAEAAAAGLQTMRFTWHQLNDEPEWVRRVMIETGSHRVTSSAA